ncbi:MAG: hypothetical protein JNL80_15290 [Phycisphaerae bacterium]|nr:hypothetical protein [Phycisphaerae bacterium]
MEFVPVQVSQGHVASRNRPPTKGLEPIATGDARQVHHFSKPFNHRLYHIARIGLTHGRFTFEDPNPAGVCKGGVLRVAVLVGQALVGVPSCHQVSQAPPGTLTLLSRRIMRHTAGERSSSNESGEGRGHSENAIALVKFTELRLSPPIDSNPSEVLDRVHEIAGHRARFHEVPKREMGVSEVRPKHQAHLWRDAILGKSCLCCLQCPNIPASHVPCAVLPQGGDRAFRGCRGGMAHRSCQSQEFVGATSPMCCHRLNIQGLKRIHI